MVLPILYTSGVILSVTNGSSHTLYYGVILSVTKWFFPYFILVVLFSV